VLRGVVGLFNAAAKSGASFRNYVSSLRLEERYPGIQGVGFSLLAGRRLERRTSITRASTSDIRPPAGRLYTSIIYRAVRLAQSAGVRLRHVSSRRATSRATGDETGKAALSEGPSGAGDRATSSPAYCSTFPSIGEWRSRPEQPRRT
jgi:hypothetical protein